MTEAQRMRREAFANFLRDVGVGAGETALSIGTGMAGQAVGGLHGLSDLVRGRGFDRAADSARGTSEALTYEPRSDIGQRGLQNVGEGIETVTKPLRENIADPIGERSPLAGAAVLTAAELIGPKGAKAKVKPKPKPQYDPGSFQQLIPGIEPLSIDKAYDRARGNLNRAQDAMSFEDLNRGLQFQYDPNWRGGGATYTMDYRDTPEAPAGEVGFSEGKRRAGSISQRPVPVAALEEPSTRTIPQGEYASPNTVQAEVGPENAQRMMALVEKLRAAEDETFHLGEQATNTRARMLNEQIARRRALLQEPDINAAQRLGLEEELLNLMRQLPMEAGGRTLVPSPAGEGQFSNLRWHDLWGKERPAAAAAQLRENPALDAQTRIVRRLRGEPETTYQPRTPAPERASLSETEGRDPNAMQRESVNAFLAGGRENPALFQYGVMPGREVRSLDDFARHFSEKSGEDIDVNWSYADSDESPKIEMKKEHGRGEVMRDRHGDYKLAEAEEGQIKYDDRGNVVTKEVEAHGPLPKGEEGPLTMEVKKKVEEGSYYMDEDGNYVYRKSEGGEPMRDERGRVKYEERDNPDYSGSEVDTATLESPKGNITIQYDDPASITATEAGGKGGGQLLYQTALAHAARAGIDIGGGSLTSINAYRLLSNVLSNIARTGKNPRDLAGTSSGRATRARGQAEGPEVWRAEAEEGRQRLLAVGADPDRVKFDPNNGFTIDGKPASPDDVKMNINELSPYAGRGQSHGGVGQKSLMRNAVFEWLRQASPEDAARVAAKWPKEWGPIFAGLGALGAGIGALQEEPQMAE